MFIEVIPRIKEKKTTNKRITRFRTENDERIDRQSTSVYEIKIDAVRGLTVGY